MATFKRISAVLLTAALVSSAAIAGCSDGSKETASDSGGKKTSEPVKLKLFMGNSGMAHPEGVNPSDNPYMNFIKEKSGVDLELEVPGYQDFKTKFNLMLSSGSLPDLVHTWYPNEAYQAADQGAFIDLKSYYDKSPIVQKVITPEMMEMAKSASGHYYRIPMRNTNAPQGSGVAVRYDMLVKYNEGKYPETVDQWIELMRKVHAAEPNSIVLSNRVANTDTALGFGGLPIFFWYGALPYQYRVQDGKVISTFQLPEYRAAVETMKMLYDEGILDKEFATNDNVKYGEKKTNKNVMFEYNSADQFIPTGQEKRPQDKDKEWQLAPALKQYPSVLKDPKYAQPYKGFPITDHGIYISSQSKHPDEAWKVIETFASDELHELIFWGKEGEDYTVKDGKKIPVEGKGLSDKSQYYKLHLGFIFGFSDRLESSIAAAEQVMDKGEFARRMEGLKNWETYANNTGLRLGNFVKLSAEAAKKVAESNNFISQATIEAIMGRITMQQFDQKVAEFAKKYGFIYDEYTNYMQEHKDELRKFGVKEVDW
ncbi:extracellular solute-binding protein [Paenibacillus thermoaerophilus]|uniref:Extracellular solute-binding protein n=1 Tax=Paenibacillus thermoaerophilus TaxID=1215385 RepID=A0ABW2V2Y8_9BACL|nr:extracellular solute-binding protein [Paenibacillus thermoaerophilus]TMV18662.1 extracellular solute-binding protein [Paenibacillus thermoaerophilus]